MLWLLSILAFIVIFSLLILIHEFGHFYVAKRCGIKVEEFGLGMPPKLFSFKPKKSETEYTLNAIPFGGFVRLYGEDSHDKKVLANSRSFASKPAWMKMAVIVAGVAMNFLLAFVLLTIGLSFGMQPLLVSADDVFQAIQNGTVKLQEGVIVKEEGTNKIGFQTGDRIVEINGKKVVFGDEITALKDNENVSFTVDRKGQTVNLKGVNQLKNPFFKIYDPLFVPQIVVLSIAESNSLNLKPGDTISKVNGKLVYSTEDLEKQLSLSNSPQIEVKSRQTIINTKPYSSSKIVVVISAIVPGSNAEKAGIREGDQVIAINGVKVEAAEDLSKALKTELIKDKVVYKVLRASSEVEFYVHKNEQGMIGVMLSGIEKSDKYQASFYIKTVPYSVIKIEDVAFPIWQAPFEAIKEMGRLSVLTVQMFGNVFATLFTKLAVPEGVAGPVGIAQMTFVFVQEGVISLMRFTALLSLSLAIINILPFPGLDGGRFILILLPLIFKKKINPKLEALIHLFGFLILMLLILLVTFNDIARLFS